MELKEQYRFNESNMSGDVKKEVFAKRNEFVKMVHKNPKNKSSMDLYTAESLSEAYDSSYEALNVVLGAMQNQSRKRFEKYTMQLKTSMQVSKVDNHYKVTVNYR